MKKKPWYKRFPMIDAVGIINRRLGRTCGNCLLATYGWCPYEGEVSSRHTCTQFILW